MALPVVNSSRYTAIIPSTEKSIEFRPFLVKEEKLLMVALESKDNSLTLRTLKDIINSCVFSELDVNRLTSFDLEYLFLKLRAKSVGENAEIQLPCEECKVPHPLTINLDTIEISKKAKAEDRVIMITQDVGLELSYPSLDTMESIDVDPSDESVSEKDKMTATMNLITSSIVSIFDADNVHAAADSTQQELNDFIDSLNSEQFSKVTEFFGDMPALIHNVEFKCRSCGAENKIELRGLQSFFT